MSALSIAELKKVFKNTDTPRYTKLVEMIDAGDKFTIDKSNIDTKLTFLDKNIEGLFRKGLLDKIATDYRGKPLFKGGNGTEYPLSKIFKSPDFGGGAGSGAGAEATAQFESGQALYAQIAWDRRKEINVPGAKKSPKITAAEFKSAYAKVDTTANLETMLDMDDRWVTSSILGANLLYQKYGRNGKKYKFHRGSKSVDIIEGAFKARNQKEKAFGDINKWSPADIYMISQQGERLINNLKETKTLRHLNEMLMKYFKDGDVVGVSLKRMEEGTAHMKELNVDQGKNEALALSGTYFQIIADNKTSMTDSMDIYAIHSKGKMQFRSFGGDALTGWQGQNAGTVAAQGKIALGPINFILRQYNLPEIPAHQEVARYVKNPDKAWLSRYWKIVYKCKSLPKGGAKKLPKTEKEFLQLWSNASDPWKYSKFMCFSLLDRMAFLPQKKRDQMMTDMFLYGSSRTSFSAPYIKLTSE